MIPGGGSETDKRKPFSFHRFIRINKFMNVMQGL